MKRAFRAFALGLAITSVGILKAHAGVPLAVAAQASGLPTLAPILKKTTPVVVIIAATRLATGSNAPAKSRRDSRRSSDGFERETRAVGSGVVFDASRGFIITNSHIIEHADEISVSLADGRVLKGTVVGSDRDTDLAVIKVRSDNLTAVSLGDSDQLEVGDFVLAIGNPFRIGQSVTAGIVSGLHRNSVGIGKYEDFIQTDAAIYPGNSGGALINLHGELVGINTGFIGSTSTNPGMGFAIPINVARFVAGQILEHGEFRRGTLGITFEDPTPAFVGRLRHSTPITGPMIVKVAAGSAAESAGMKSGDIVTGLARASVRDAPDLRSRIGLLSVGETAELTVLRDGQLLDIRLPIIDRERSFRSK